LCSINSRIESTRIFLLLSPFTPFIADELWKLLGNEGYTIEQPLPIPDEEALIETTKEIPVQVNGKVRATITVPTDAEILAAQDEVELIIESKKYIKKRQADYPSIPDQLDEIYHNGIDSWKAVIKVTKDKYPKG